MPMGSGSGAPTGRYDWNLEEKRRIDAINRKRFEDEQKRKRIEDFIDKTPSPTPAPAPGKPIDRIAPLPTGPAPETSAIMARAKDRAGLTARGALTGLREALGERGVLGSGIEGRATSGLAEAGMREIADVNREAAIQEAEQARRREEMIYHGNITQRGQDIDMRGQDLGAAENAARRRSDLLRILLGKLRGSDLGF